MTEALLDGVKWGMWCGGFLIAFMLCVVLMGFIAGAANQLKREWKHQQGRRHSRELLKDCIGFNEQVIPKGPVGIKDQDIANGLSGVAKFNQHRNNQPNNKG